jgi:hydroxyacylglutathione hydrolase
MPSQFIEFSTSQPNPDISNVRDVDPQEVNLKRDQVVLIDVRRPDEYTGELGHVAGSSLIVLDNLPQQLEEIPRDKTVVFICRSGGRSARAASFAMSEGFTSVFNMKGGMLAWKALNQEVEGG